jgi:hypothetical protein
MTIVTYICVKIQCLKKSLKIPFIEEEQTTQWPKEKLQKDKQRFTKHTYKTKDRVTRTLLKTGTELRCLLLLISITSTNDELQSYCSVDSFDNICQIKNITQIIKCLSFLSS